MTPNKALQPTLRSDEAELRRWASQRHWDDDKEISEALLDRSTYRDSSVAYLR
jgi:hypothetical protein